MCKPRFGLLYQIFYTITLAMTSFALQHTTKNRIGKHSHDNFANGWRLLPILLEKKLACTITKGQQRRPFVRDDPNSEF